MVESSLFPYLFFSFIGFLLSAPVTVFLYYSYYKLKNDYNALIERVVYLEDFCGSFLSFEVNKGFSFGE